jgi:hypothetical protein
VYFWTDSTVREDGVFVVSQQCDAVVVFPSSRRVCDLTRTIDGRCFERNAVSAAVNAIVFEDCVLDRCDRSSGSM